MSNMLPGNGIFSGNNALPGIGTGIGNIDILKGTDMGFLKIKVLMIDLLILEKRDLTEQW